MRNQHGSSIPVLATGHSLGGALATLAAVDIKKKLGGDVEFINFGSPRVGNKEFFDYFHS